MNPEKKVGLFFCVGMIALGILTVLAEDINPFNQGYALSVRFHNAAGLQKGDPVKLAGVEVGSVNRIDIVNDENTSKQVVEVGLRIEDSAEIRTDSTATINVNSLLGGRFIALSSGSTKASVAEHDYRLESGESFDIDKLLKKVDEAVTGIGNITKKFDEQDFSALEKIGKMFEENEEGVAKFMSSLGEMAPDLRETVAALKAVITQIKEGEGFVGKMVADEELYPQLQEAIANLQSASLKAEGILSANEENINETLAALRETVPHLKSMAVRLDEITADIQDGQSGIGKLLNDEQVFDDIREGMASLRRISAKLENPEGSIGRFLADETLYEDVTAAVKEARATMKSVRDTVEGAGEQIPLTTFTSVIFSAF